MRSSLAAVPLEDSPYLEAIPNFQRCDVTVTPANFTAALAQVNDPARRVFCVQPGDYRSFGEVLLLVSGTQQSRRFLRFDAQDSRPNAVLRAERAIFEKVNVAGSWWVIQGLTIQPKNGGTGWFLSLYGADHVVADGNLIDGIDQVPTAATRVCSTPQWNRESASCGLRGRRNRH